MKIKQKEALKNLLGSHNYERLRAFKRLGYIPDYKNPRTFNEKIIHRKHYKPVRDGHIYADKVAVRDYVKRKVGEGFLTKVYYTGQPEGIPFADLPDKFVVKTNHGCGGNYFVRDKNSTKVEDIVTWCKQALADDYGYITNESLYRDIDRQILIEEFLQTDHDIPPDYKFYCFHGKCHYVLVDFDRFTNHKQTIFDADWNLQPFTRRYPRGPVIDKPRNFDLMKQVAETLSSEIDFARIDLYGLESGIKFGEITLTPDAGWGRFSHKKWDYELGALWSDLPPEGQSMQGQPERT